MMQIRNEVATMRYRSGGNWSCPLVIRVPVGGYIHGSLYHSQSIDGYFAHTPGLKVVYPSNASDAKGLLKAAIRDNDPVVFMESEQMYGDKGEVPEGEYIIPIGVADVVREGSDVTLVSFGKIMKKVKEAADLLTEEGIEADVIDLRTVRPIDYDTIISSVKKTNRLVIVEEAWPLASLSSDIAFNVQRDAFDHMDAPVKRVCTADVPMAYAPNLVEEFMPKVSKIVEEVKSVMYVK